MQDKRLELVKKRDLSYFKKVVWVRRLIEIHKILYFLAMKKTIAYFVTEDWYFVSHRLGLAKEAIRQGYDAYIFTNISDKTRMIEDSGVKIIPANFSRELSPINDLLTVFKILVLIIKIRPNIIHAVALKPIALSAISSLFFPSITKVFAISGLGNVFTKNSRKYNFIRSALSLFLKVFIRKNNSKIILQNKSDLKTIKSILPDHSLFLIRGAGVNTTKYRPGQKTSTRKTKVLMASRLLWSKGIKEYFESASTLQGENYDFFIAGAPDKGNSDSLTKKNIQELAKAHQVTWLGNIPDMYNELPKYDIFVLPTYYGEGIPKVLIEAASCGLPIITTDLPGCNDIVTHEYNGFLIKPKDSSDIIKRLQRLVKDRKLRIFFSENSRDKAVKCFSSTIIHKQTLNLYEN